MSTCYFVLVAKLTEMIQTAHTPPEYQSKRKAGLQIRALDSVFPVRQATFFTYQAKTNDIHIWNFATRVPKRRNFQAGGLEVDMACTLNQTQLSFLLNGQMLRGFRYGIQHIYHRGPQLVQEIYDVNIYETIQENIYLCRIA
jgi:hypothetical protein